MINSVPTMGGLFPGRNLDGGFSFNDPSIVARYDASSSDSITFGSGLAIAQWADLSGNGYHAAQTDPTLQPVYDNDAYNGKPALVFDNSNDMLQLITTAGLLRNVPRVTVFAVVRLDASALSNVFISYVAIGSAVRARLIGGTNSYNIAARRLDADTFVNINGGTRSGGEQAILCGEYLFDDGEIKLYRDNTLLNTAALPSSGSLPDTDSSGIFIGPPAASGPLNGLLAELVIAHDASDFLRGNIYNHLLSKWA